MVVDRQAGDWFVDQVFVRSNQEVVIADGVVVRALKGAFHDPNHRLVNLIGITNAVLRGEGSAQVRMERDEYADRSKYVYSEWRHGVYVSRSCNVTVRDLDVAFSGGDGVYVCDSENVEICNVDAHDNYRLAMAVTDAVRGLKVRRCRFRDTRGTPPEGGFDFEPNEPKGFLVDCLVEDCVFEGSGYGGFFTHFLQLDATTEPLSIVMRNCVISGKGGTGAAATLTFASDRRTPVRGKFLLDRCRIEAEAALMAINGKSADNELVFRDCVFDAAGKDVGILFVNRDLTRDFANVRFENSRLLTEAREPIIYYGKVGTGVIDVGGTLEVVSSKGTSPFDFAAFQARHRPDPEVLKLMCPLPIDYPRLRPVSVEAVRSADYPLTRGRFTFVQYAPKAGEYAVTFKSRQLGRKREFKIPVAMRDRLGTALGSFSLTSEVQRVVFRTEGENVRLFDVMASGCAVAVSPECPGHGISVDDKVNFFCGTHRLYFTVPAGVKEVVLEIVPEEPVAARLLNAAGEVVRKVEKTQASVLIRQERPDTARAEVWSLAVKAEEDFIVRFGAGTLPLVSTSAGSALYQ